MPTLHGVSVFGTKLCFYTLSKATREITPAEIQESRRYAIDTAPLERWNFDILSAEGEVRFREVVTEIVDGYGALPKDDGEVQG